MCFDKVKKLFPKLPARFYTLLLKCVSCKLVPRLPCIYTSNASKDSSTNDLTVEKTNGSKQFPALIFRWVVITTLYYLMLQSNFFILLTFDKHDETQLLTKFKKNSVHGPHVMGFRATLNFRKFKVALNPMYRIFLNFAKSCVSSCLSKIDNVKKFQRAVLEL